MVAFPFKEIVIAAATGFRITAADARPMLVDCAPPPGSIEEAAHALEDVVFTVAENTAVTAYELGEPGLRFFMS